jgi:hypothetical protein
MIDVRWLRFDARGSFLGFSLVAWHLALIPSLLLVLVAHGLFEAAGADVEALSKPAVEVAGRNPFYAVVAAPVIETLVLALLIELLSRVMRHTQAIAIVSALAWGAAHAYFHPLWFFGTVWSFYVFSRGYLAWRPVSYKHAFGAAAVPHALVNSSALLLQFLAKS